MTKYQSAAGTAKNRLSSRDLALVASFAALIAVLGLPGNLHVFGNAVPLTLQTLGIMLAGSVLGCKRGALAVIVFLVLVAAGLPLLAGGRGGLALFAGPSAGYLFGFIFGAAAVGWLVERRLPAYPIWWGALANLLGGMGVVILMGIPVLAFVTHVPLWAAASSALVFIPGDLVKVAIATTVASAVHRAYPGITAGRGAADVDRAAQQASARQ
jgi:biotin transport system substrate-specific component